MLLILVLIVELTLMPLVVILIVVVERAMLDNTVFIIVEWFRLGEPLKMDKEGIVVGESVFLLKSILEYSTGSV